MRDGFAGSWNVSNERWDEIFKDEPMIIKVVCEQCGEEFENEILHKKSSVKKYCDRCLLKRERLRYRLKQKCK